MNLADLHQHNSTFCGNDTNVSLTSVIRLPKPPKPVRKMPSVPQKAARGDPKGTPSPKKDMRGLDMPLSIKSMHRSGASG